MQDSWNYSWLIRNIIAEFLMPPTIWIVLACILTLCFRKRKNLQITILSISLVMIWITSTPIFSHWLIQATNPWMHWPEPFSQSQIEQINEKKEQLTKKSTNDLQKNLVAIVILGGGLNRGAIELPQYQSHDVSDSAMERLRMGARLAKLTHLPILVTGGAPDGKRAEDLAEGDVMAMVLETELGVKAQWIENQSNTTQENATLSAQILKSQNIQKVYLVTQYWHMPRAQTIFEKQGFQIIPVPVGYNLNYGMTPLDLAPKNVSQTRHVWHECIGKIWYLLRFS